MPIVLIDLEFANKAVLDEDDVVHVRSVAGIGVGILLERAHEKPWEANLDQCFDRINGTDRVPCRIDRLLRLRHRRDRRRFAGACLGVGQKARPATGADGLHAR